MRFTQFLILEAREDYVAQQMGNKLMAAFQRDNGQKPSIERVNPLVIVKHLAQAGPEYVQWIAKQYANGTIKWEDIQQVKSDLIAFKQLSKANAVPNKDINSYPTIASLRQVTRNKSVAGEEYKGKYEKLYQGIDEAVKKGLGKWLYNTPTDPVKIYIPTSVEGSVCIRRAYPDITWCTTHEDEDLEDVKAQLIQDCATDEWDRIQSTIRPENADAAWEALIKQISDEIDNGDYDDTIAEARKNQHEFYIKNYGGEFYVILTPDGPYQFHFESNQFKDQNDEDIDYKQLVEKYPSIKKILAPIVNKIGHPHFLPAEGVAAIKKAIMASYENMPLVQHKQLSYQDWADIILRRLGNLDPYADSKQVTQILSKANSAMAYKGSMRPHDRGTVFDKIVQALPRQISSNQLPYDVLQAIDPEIGKKYIRLYVPPKS